MICPKCKKKIKKQSFCPNCGENLEKAREDKKAKFQENVYKIKLRITIVLVLIFVILLATIIIMKQVFSSKNFKQFEAKVKPKEIEHISSKDYEYIEAKVEDFELTDDNKEEDFDGDGLTNEKEVEIGTDPFDKDTDGDNLSDYDEINTHNSDPLKYSTANDDISDYAKVNLKLDVNKKYEENDVELTEIKTNNDKVVLIPANLEAKAKGKFEEYSSDKNLDTNEKAFAVYGFKGKIKYELSSGNDALLLTYYMGEYTEYDDYEVEGKTMTINVDDDDNAKVFVITTKRNYKAYLKGEEK